MVLLLLCLPFCLAILPVQENESRWTRTLDGLWTFVRDTHNGDDVGLRAKWNEMDMASFPNATVMPVPCAFNELGDAGMRDHVGWVWYQRKEILPRTPSAVSIRVDSANYASVVFVNSVLVGRHEGGHLPFQFDISHLIQWGRPNKITIAVNNTLSWHTIPNGDFNYKTATDVDRYPPGYFTMRGNFDFFHYGGLLRPVRLLFAPNPAIEDISIVAHANGSLRYDIAQSLKEAKLYVSVEDDRGSIVHKGRSSYFDGVIEGVKAWWPRGLGSPSLYTLTAKVFLPGNGGFDLVDTATVTFGFRTVTWDKQKIYWNGKPFYCQGMGMHEEADIRGRAYDPVLMTKDLNLLEWTNANCYRTSHYPYAEERMAESDRRGIAVIVETPAVGLKSFSNANAQLHKNIVEEMIKRDRHHPSVLMWSMANEPQTYRNESRGYFEQVISHARSLNSPSIPITAVYGPTQSYNDVTADLLDVICVNRYYGWYIDIGALEQIEHSLYNDFTTWKERFGRSLLITEYGAESIPGMHKEPSFVFTEDYQLDVFTRTHAALDRLLAEGTITGEMLWVFADFMTEMDTTRVVGNHKGIFTRQREPKKSAFLIRERYGKRLSQPWTTRVEL